jgi:hypothetical protein
MSEQSSETEDADSDCDSVSHLSHSPINKFNPISNVFDIINKGLSAGVRLITFAKHTAAAVILKALIAVIFSSYFHKNNTKTSTTSVQTAAK